jgi:hypothetical protein
MANPGNTDHKGYKMAKVTSITHDESAVIVSLNCGHAQRLIPYPGYTPASYARHIQQPPSAMVVGRTRRCHEKHEA